MCYPGNTHCVTTYSSHGCIKVFLHVPKYSKFQIAFRIFVLLDCFNSASDPIIARVTSSEEVAINNLPQANFIFFGLNLQPPKWVWTTLAPPKCPLGGVCTPGGSIPAHDVDILYFKSHNQTASLVSNSKLYCRFQAAHMICISLLLKGTLISKLCFLTNVYASASNQLLLFCVSEIVCTVKIPPVVTCSNSPAKGRREATGVWRWKMIILMMPWFALRVYFITGECAINNAAYIHIPHTTYTVAGCLPGMNSPR